MCSSAAGVGSAAGTLTQVYAPTQARCCASLLPAPNPQEQRKQPRYGSYNEENQKRGRYSPLSKVVPVIVFHPMDQYIHEVVLRMK